MVRLPVTVSGLVYIVNTLWTEYEEPYDESRARPLPEKATPFSRFLGTRDGSSLAQAIERKKRGIGRQRYPFVGASVISGGI